jgi:hypothetical protein
LSQEREWEYSFSNVLQRPSEMETIFTASLEGLLAIKMALAMG